MESLEKISRINGLQKKKSKRFLMKNRQGIFRFQGDFLLEIIVLIVDALT